MQFTAGFLALLAISQSVVAFPYAMSETTLTPAPVGRLLCDSNTYECTANLNYGDGRWVARWTTAIFHTSLFGAPDHKETMAALAMAPIRVTTFACDSDTYKCTANLDVGDGRWVAQWSANIFHQNLRSDNFQNIAPAPSKRLTCDADTFKCTANLDSGDGRWVAQWSTNVFHNSNFLEQN